MAKGAPKKKALDYFPKMCNFYDDDKIMDLLEEYGPLGVTVYDCILMTVYAHGYYVETSIDKLSRKIVRDIGNRWAKKAVVMQVILFCADIGLIDDALLNQGVITSAGIQRRYYEVAVRLMKRQLYDKKYWLIELDENGDPQPLLNAPKNKLNSEENRFNSELNRDNSKNLDLIPTEGKERKGKEKKRKERKECAACDDSLSDYFSDEDFAHVVSEFEHSGFMLSGRARDELIDMLDTYSAEWTIEAIHRAADRGKKSIAYIRGILNNWQQKGAIDDERSSNTSKDSGENKSVIDFSDGWTVV